MTRLFCFSVATIDQSKIDTYSYLSIFVPSRNTCANVFGESQQ